MGLIEKAKQLIADEEVRQGSVDSLADAIEALMGDTTAIARLLYDLLKGTQLFQQRLFMFKFEAFLSGVYIDEETADALSKKLVSGGNSSDDAMRIVSCIDRADSKLKIDYLVNATKCLLADFIGRELYFRICNSITGTLMEDLQYLREHLGEADVPYNDSVQGLLQTGLMYMSCISDVPTYSFTPLAHKVDRWAVSYRDVIRYPNPLKETCDMGEVRVSIDGGQFGNITWEQLRGQ